ncbi:MAG: hypothetical protein IT435_01050 [Phycisphaerales bacterium]|nr:hypothetical protein [Phycisphaerales bacterium]
MRRCVVASMLGVGVGVGCSAVAAHAGQFASAWVSYDAGVDAAAGYVDPTTAIGSPTRTSGFDLRVTPFNPPFQSSEVVSIGKGGHLTLAFDTPVADDPANPFGIDLLVFGNSFFYSDDFSPIAQHIWNPGGIVEVSADGIAWEVVSGAIADGLFPTMGWNDSTDPFGSDGGASPSDFHLPVNPAFGPWGSTFDDLKAGYAGSGGGAGIDLALVGLPAISFIRISNTSDAPYSIEIDAVSDVVPSAPSAVCLVIGVLANGRRRVR